MNHLRVPATVISKTPTRWRNHGSHQPVESRATDVAEDAGAREGPLVT